MSACLHSASPTLHAQHTRRVTLSSVPRLALTYFSTLSHKQHDFREKSYWTFYTITLRNFVVPTLSMVSDPLSGNGCGSPNHILLSFHLRFIYSFYSW